ncbi:MAG: endonuclease domain-containing protein [Chloroflexota bacterium]|nr:endonuclease domain-containing protein [Chloroflexota bacterium]
MNQGTSPRYIIPCARELRREQTKAEELLWHRVRNRQLAKAKFRRQHPAGRYVLDFYCHEARLAVELDGDIHDYPDQAAYDKARRTEIREGGVRLLVFRNQEIFADLDRVLIEIREALLPGSPPTKEECKPPSP